MTQEFRQPFVENQVFRGLSLRLSDAKKKQNVFIDLGGIQDLIDYQVEEYRHQTKCIHQIDLIVTIDYVRAIFDFHFKCKECKKQETIDKFQPTDSF